MIETATFRLPAPPQTVFTSDAFAAQVGEFVFVAVSDEEPRPGMLMSATVAATGAYVDLTLLIEDSDG